MKFAITCLMILSLGGCGGLIKGCTHSLKQLFDSPPAPKPTPTPQPKPDDAPVRFDDFEIVVPRQSEFEKDYELTRFLDAPLEECTKIAWREQLKQEVRMFSMNPEEASRSLGKELEGKIKGLFDKRLISLGPVQAVFAPVDGEFVLTVDTPCGTERLLAKQDAEPALHFEVLPLVERKLEERTRNMLIGSWRSQVEIPMDNVTLVQVFDDTEYLNDGTARSDATLVFTELRTGRIFFSVDMRAVLAWRLDGMKLVYSLTSVDFSNPQGSARRSFDIIRQGLLGLRNQEFAETISVITDKALLSIDEEGELNPSMRI